MDSIDPTNYPPVPVTCLRKMQGSQLFAVLLSWLAFNSASTSTSASTTLSDAKSLQSIKAAWKLNSSWWQGDNPCEGWERVQCDTNNRVTYLNLSNLGIHGPIPEEIRNLDHLTYLDLGNPRNSTLPYNFITGGVSALGSLTSLLHLNLSFNSLQLDSFPAVIYSLTNLISLRMDNNLISGLPPKELARLKNLTYLYLGNNSFVGPIPKEYGELTNLQELSMWNNDLNSTIPSEFGYLQNLTYLNLHDCMLYGGLPKELGSLKKIRNISLYSNKLTGEIPETWRNLTNLTDLSIAKNYLTKSIPPWLLTLPNLYNVSLGYNLFYGDLNLENISVPIISVTCNFLSGAAPKPSNRTSLNSIGNCFNGADVNEKIKCYQSYYDCNSFFHGVPDGSCPDCPLQQYLYDTATCVCMISVPTGGSASHMTQKVIGSISGVVALIACALLIWWRWSVMHKQRSKDLWDSPEGVHCFLYQDLLKATNGFNISHEIGNGGFGKVYCGVVDGKIVAIKRAHASSIQSTSGFRNEVTLLSRLHHRNLVRLLGFCEENETQILVYEYMPNGNLQSLLFRNQGRIQLDWLKRLDIALGIAQGLDYLHSFADPPVIHRDVKPSNILLDENLVAKLSDFGISKVALEFQTQYSTKPAGTVGYIDPQYILREHLTTASDVYSFGMVLLELISGQKSIDHTRCDEQNLVEWVKIKLQTEDLRCIVDPRLTDDYPEKVYYDMTRLAIDCASFISENRPSMKVVVSILEACRWSVAPRVVEEAEDVYEGSIHKGEQEDACSTRGNVLMVTNDDQHSLDGISVLSVTTSLISGR